MLTTVDDKNNILHQVSKDIDLKTNDAKRLCRKLNKLVNTIGGYGLSAPQINESLSIFVVNPNIFDAPKCFINPKIINRSNDREKSEEMCLSVPNEIIKIDRYKTVVISFYDLRGRKKEMEFTGLLSFVVQHEIDHLNGILITDRINL